MHEISKVYKLKTKFFMVKTMLTLWRVKNKLLVNSGVAQRNTVK